MSKRIARYTIAIRGQRYQAPDGSVGVMTVREQVGPFIDRVRGERCMIALATQGATDMELAERAGEAAEDVAGAQS